MTRQRRLKRRILRQAVQENVDSIEGRFRPRRARRASALARSLAFVALPALLFTTYLLAAISEARFPRRAPSAAAGGEALATGSLGSSLPPEVSAVSLQAPLEPPAPLSPGVFPLAVHKIVIDAGHGGRNAGTLGPGGLVEKELTLDVALRLEELLTARSFEVEMTRREDRTVSLEERAELANRRRGDIFVSIHVNWIGARNVRGVETYYLGPTDDPFLNELAATENRGSGYSLADFRQLVERVYANARQDESLRLAREVQRALHGALTRISPDLQDRGVKRAPFAVLTGTEMPAILAEVSCLSNEEEARLLRLPEYRQFIAEALAHGIRSYALQSTAGPAVPGS